MKDYLKSIKTILFDELSKCNKYYYDLKFDKLNLKVNTKKPNQILFYNSYYLVGKSNDRSIFDYHNHDQVWISYVVVWSRIEKETKLDHDEIVSLLNNKLTCKPYEDFNLNKIVGFNLLNYYIN